MFLIDWLAGVSGYRTSCVRITQENEGLKHENTLMGRVLLRTSDELSTLRREKRELETRLAETEAKAKEADAQLQEILMRGIDVAIASTVGRLDIELKKLDRHQVSHWFADLFAGAMGGLLKAHDVENYVELEVDHPEFGPLILRVQRKNGKTPAQVCRERVAEIDRLKSTLKQKYGEVETDV